LTLDLQQAADFLKLHPVTLAERARAGKIPGAAKPGKRWVFPEEGLRAYLNAKSTCPYTGEEASGGSSSPRTAAELESLLGLPTRKRHGNTTRKGRGSYGGRQSSAKPLP
jgi:hypothetical protein